MGAWSRPRMVDSLVFGMTSNNFVGGLIVYIIFMYRTYVRRNMSRGWKFKATSNPHRLVLSFRKSPMIEYSISLWLFFGISPIHKIRPKYMRIASPWLQEPTYIRVQVFLKSEIFFFRKFYITIRSTNQFGRSSKKLAPSWFFWRCLTAQGINDTINIFGTSYRFR